jgi:HAD superfamily hydrolase (TIGR01509 family)
MKVVFDVGKVLAHAHMQWKDALAASGLEFRQTDLYEKYLYDLPQYLPYEGGQISQDTYLSALSAEFGLAGTDEAKHLHESIIGDEYPGVAEIVRELNQARHQTATLSNNNPIHWAVFTESGNYPAIEAIQHQIASFHLGLFKPDPAIFPKFCEHLGWDKSEIVFLDDAEKNIVAARNAGWVAHLIGDEEPKADQIRRILDLTRTQ